MTAPVESASCPVDHRGIDQRSAADVLMRRVLRVQDAPPLAGADKRDKTAQAQKAFNTSVLVSATRCLLTYIVLPFVAPLVGIAKGVGPWIGIVVGSIGIVANVVTMRRFFRADYKYRWVHVVIATVFMTLLVVLIFRDLHEILV